MFNSARLATSVSAVALALAAMAPSHAGVVGTTASVTAVTGWNLLGYSDPTAVNVIDAFGDANKVITVWKWDLSNPASPKWAFYSPSFTTPTALADYAASKGYSVLTTINSGEGFWVNAKNSFSAALPTVRLAASTTTSNLSGPEVTFSARGAYVGGSECTSQISGSVLVNAATDSACIMTDTNYSPNFIENLAANDPDGIGSYTVISSITGAQGNPAISGVIASGTGAPPSTILSRNTTGYYSATEEITISISDNGNPVKTTTKVVTFKYFN